MAVTTGGGVYDDVLLADVSNSLGEWIGSVLPGVEQALQQIGVDTWTQETRNRVLELVSRSLVESFESGRGSYEHRDDSDWLKDYAMFSLATYVVARARVRVLEL